jgi:hypothetical protein
VSIPFEALRSVRPSDFNRITGTFPKKAIYHGSGRAMRLYVLGF